MSIKYLAEIAKAAETPLQKIKEVFKLSEVNFKKEKNTGDKFFSAAAKRYKKAHMKQTTVRHI